MLEFQGLRPYSPNATSVIPHIHPLTNTSLSILQRGTFSIKILNTPSGPLFSYNYQPPPLELYTKFSLQAYFFSFWVILILQTLTIFAIDKIWVKNVQNMPHCGIEYYMQYRNLVFLFPIPTGIKKREVVMSTLKENEQCRKKSWLQY